jgi:adenylate cyclase
MFTFRSSITFAVMAFILALAALLIAIQVRVLHWATQEAAAAYMDATSTKAFGRLQTEITAMASLVRVLATSSSVTDSNERTETGPAIALFKAALQELPQMDSIYAGFENGGWLQVRRTSDLNEEQRERLRATAHADIAINLVRPTPSGELPMRRIFEDRQGSDVGQLDLWKYGYDARKRPWYQETMKVDRSLVSLPYLSFSVGAPVITVSAPLRGKVPGVLAADLKLDTFSDFRPSATAWRARYRLDFRLGRLPHRPSKSCRIYCECDDASIPTAIAQHQGDQLGGRSGCIATVG